MATKRRISDRNPDALRTVRMNGEAPQSRIRRASQVHRICKEMVENNRKRSAKQDRVYKAYKRFPPTDYSTLVQLKMEDQSNVNWGMMAFIVNNNRGSFYDMIAERSTACEIQTKIGDPIERRMYSDLIGEKYDEFALRKDHAYLQGQEISILDMNLYGKGIHMFEDGEGHISEPIPARDFFVPEDTHISLEKFDLFMRRRKYHLHELWQRIKDKDSAESRGWNVEGVKEAMRCQRDEWLRQYSNEDFSHDIANGRMALTSVMKEVVHVFDFYVREFDGTISRMIVLQDYSPMTHLVNEKRIARGKEAAEKDDDNTIDECGFLFCKQEYAKDVREVVCVFIDNSGSGEWHDTPSIAEEVFVQCRQYDIIMNSIMDAIKLNMTLMLQGQTADATEKLKSMVWGQFAVLPSDMPFVQQRVQMDTTSATTTIQYMMSDLYSGIGHYKVQGNSPTGDKPTATQTQIDSAESAKLSGTQIRRFNEQQTVYHQERYRRFVSLTRGMPGYEHYKQFCDELEDAGVPKEAWEYKNIRSISSNMIAGPGSPSYKMMASEKIIAITNMTAKDDGQRAAMEDAIAALAGRQNVRRYMAAKDRLNPEEAEKLMGLECEAFSMAMLNPRNVQVYPNDNHVAHISYHLDDMAQTVMKLQDAMKEQKIDKEMAMAGLTRLTHEGAHVGAHMQFLMRDKGKEVLVKEYSSQLATIQKAVEQLQQQLQKLMEEQQAQQSEFDPANDPDIQKKIAMGQLEVQTAEKLANIKMGAIAQQHETRDQIQKDKATTDIAIARAKANVELESKKQQASIKKLSPPKAKP